MQNDRFTVLYLLGLEMATYLEDPLNYESDKLYWLIDEAVRLGGLTQKEATSPYWTAIDDKGIDISPSRTHGFPTRDFASRFAAGFFGSEVRVAMCEPPLDHIWAPSEEQMNTIHTRMMSDGVDDESPSLIPLASEEEHESEKGYDPRQRMEELGLQLLDGGKKAT